MKKSADNKKVLYGRLPAGLAAAASTAVGTVVIVGLSLVARATSGSSGLWWMFGVLTSSFAVLGGSATVGRSSPALCGRATWLIPANLLGGVQ